MADPSHCSPELITPLPQQKPQSEGHEEQVSEPLHTLSPHEGGRVQPLVFQPEQPPLQASVPPEKPPGMVVQLLPPRSTPSQVSPDSLTPLPHTGGQAPQSPGQLEHVSAPLQLRSPQAGRVQPEVFQPEQPPLQASVPPIKPPGTVVQLLPPRSDPSQTSEPSLVLLPHTGGQTPQSPGQLEHVSAPLQTVSPQEGGRVQLEVFQLQVMESHASAPPVKPPGIEMQVCPLRGLLLDGSHFSAPEMNESLQTAFFLEMKKLPSVRDRKNVPVRLPTLP